MLSIRKFIKILGAAISKNSPHILTVLAALGIPATALLAIRNDRDAGLAFGQKGKEVYEREHTVWNPTKKELVKLYWKYYIPAVLMGLITMGCTIGSNRIGTRRIAALAGAYSLKEVAFSEYKDKVAELMGKGKEQKVRDELAADSVRNNPPSDNAVIITGKGDYLCYVSGQYFRSDIEKIRQIIQDFNESLQNQWEIFRSVNDFHELLGLKRTDLGEDVGWDVNNILKVHFTTCLTDANEPCIVLAYQTKPKHLY